MDFYGAFFHFAAGPSAAVAVDGDFAADHFFACVHTDVAVNGDFASGHALPDAFDFAAFSVKGDVVRRIRGEFDLKEIT